MIKKILRNQFIYPQSDILNKLKQWCEIYSKQSHLGIYLLDRNENCYYSIGNGSSLRRNFYATVRVRYDNFISLFDRPGGIIPDLLYDDGDFIIYSNCGNKRRDAIMESIKRHIRE